MFSPIQVGPGHTPPTFTVSCLNCFVVARCSAQKDTSMAWSLTDYQMNDYQPRCAKTQSTQMDPAGSSPGAWLFYVLKTLPDTQITNLILRHLKGNHQTATHPLGLTVTRENRALVLLVTTSNGSYSVFPIGEDKYIGLEEFTI